MKNTLLSNMAVLVLVLYVLVSLPACGDKSLDTVESNQPNAFRIPRIDEPSHFDATDEYVGVISDNKHSFQLLDLQGNIAFSEHVDPGGFFWIEMRDYDGFLILAWAETEGYATFTVYDYTGRKLFHVWCQALLKASPSGQFYFTMSEGSFTAGAPTIYDSQGKVLKEFTVRGLWQMMAVNDSLLVLEDNDRVQLIAIPEMTVLREVIVDGVRSTGESQQRSLSPDGTHYAFLTARDIAVCDLYNESAVLVPVDHHGETRTTPAIFLSPNADYLLTHHNPMRTQTLDVFKKEGATYVKMVDDFTIPIEGAYIRPVKGTFVSDHVLAASFASWGSNGLQPRTFLYRFDTAEAVASGLALEGFIWINPQSPERINRLTIDTDAGTASVSEIVVPDI